MLKRYIGSADEVTVSIMGQDYGIVKKGDSIPVPDDIANAVSWAEENWEDGTPVKDTSKGKGTD
jgi:hypothetical protein